MSVFSSLHEQVHKEMRVRYHFPTRLSLSNDTVRGSLPRVGLGSMEGTTDMAKQNTRKESRLFVKIFVSSKLPARFLRSSRHLCSACCMNSNVRPHSSFVLHLARAIRRLALRRWDVIPAFRYLLSDDYAHVALVSRACYSENIVRLYCLPGWDLGHKVSLRARMMLTIKDKLHDAFWYSKWIHLEVRKGK